jgi:hypothetical protein
MVWFDPEPRRFTVAEGPALSPTVARTLLAAGCMVAAVQSAQLVSLPADDPVGPIPYPVLAFSPAGSGALYVQVSDTVTGDERTGDLLPQWRMTAHKSRV